MRLEQVIRSTMTEAMDMDGRLDQLVRAGLMPTSSLPLLKRAISRMHAGMSLQGAERDVMNMFISSMMFIVLGDDTVFNKARAGAKSYAAEEVELDENAPIVAHLTKRYGDNIRKSHVMSAAKDFGVDASKLAKAVRTKLGKNMLDEEDDGWYTHSQMHGSKKSEKHPKGISADEWKSGIRWHHGKNKRINIKEAKEKTEYDYEGDMAMGQLKSIIANSQRMHDMLSDDTNLPEWVQSKITLAEDYISTASNYMQGEMNESKDGMPFEGPYKKAGERKDKYGNTVKNVPQYLAKKAMNAQKNEEAEPVEEKRGLWDNIHAKRKRIKAGSGERMRKPGSEGAPSAADLKSARNEEVETIDELSRATVGSYARKAKAEADNLGGFDDHRAKGRELAGRKRWGGTMKGVKKAKVMATESRRGEAMADIAAFTQMNESYKTTFDAALTQYGIKSPSELDEEKRKQFFNFVDQEYKKGDN